MESLKDVLPLLYEETVVKKDLIRQVKMGPFEHKVDDGLEARKVFMKYFLSTYFSFIEFSHHFFFSRLHTNVC